MTKTEYILLVEDNPEDEMLTIRALERNKIESEMTYPGEIQVTLLREVRCIEYAK